MQGAGVCCFTDKQASALVISVKSFRKSWTRTRSPPQLPQNLAMEMKRKPSEDDSNNPTDATTQMASAMLPSDKELAIAVITTYLLERSKEFRQLKQLRQQVSFHSSLYVNHCHVTNNATRDGRTPKATNSLPISVPVQTLQIRALRSKQSRARRSSSR